MKETNTQRIQYLKHLFADTIQELKDVTASKEDAAKPFITEALDRMMEQELLLWEGNFLY
jgi:hypothetical protein